ncbi:hypothetical protein GA0070607_5658 [Micromonospora coriariae]|uniref:Uncharacterized protein n=1 Tax=Micromonospora coriariae TaxID=285665 RepID=A0A1C4XSH7_9ACTN|nr:hypothetical protein [Micromonospora coriariae]SCF11051.1 hypothetical protein GA0070607_5658 [Micromonospora coriariae]
MGALVTTVTTLALVAGVVTFLTTGAGRTAVRVLLELLTAAGLLRLVGDPSWASLAGSAAIVALRLLLGAALGAAQPWSCRQSRPPCAADDHHLPLAVRGDTGVSGRTTT